jgi:4-amino-4-deoxy-L-arabinose transferase-like glycosyltransferase
LNVDEGYFIAFALRMIDGRFLPYVDAVSLRGPVLYYLTAVAVWLFGPSAGTIRALSFICSSAVTALIFGAACLARRPFVGAVGVLGWALLCVAHSSPSDAIAYNGEVVLDVFAMGSLASLLVAFRASRPGARTAWFFASGALVSLAALSKQVGIACALPLGLWVVVAAVSRREHPVSERRLWVAAFGGGFVLPLAIVLARYAAAGELHSLYYYTIVYNRDVYALRGAVRHDAFDKWLTEYLPFSAFGAVVLGGLGARILSSPERAARYDRDGFVMTLAFETTCTAIAANASLRDFGHYYLLVYPWAALLAGAVVERLLRPSRAIAVELVALLIPAVLIAWGAAAERDRFKRLDDIGMLFGLPTKGLCEYVDKHSEPWSPILVWGFRPDVYVDCKRRAASRFVYTSFPAGVVIADPSPRDRDSVAVPGSRAELLADLEETKPKIIVDAGKSLPRHPRMNEYPVFAAYLDEHYCADGAWLDWPLYLRKQPGTPCPPPHP